MVRTSFLDSEAQLRNVFGQFFGTATGAAKIANRAFLLDELISEVNLENRTLEK